MLAHHNANMWWFILAAANVGALVLLLLLIVRSRGGWLVPILIVWLSIWVIVNAVLVPFAITQMRKRIVVDFDRGTLTTHGTIYPVSEFQSLIATSRSFPGHASLLTFAYQRGSVEVQVSGFTPNAQTLVRDEALLAFIWRWLPLPDNDYAYLGTKLLLTKHRIGKNEALALLRGTVR